MPDMCQNGVWAVDDDGRRIWVPCEIVVRTWELDLAEYRRRRRAARAWESGFHDRMNALYDEADRRARANGMVPL